MSSQPDNPNRIGQALRLGWRSVRVGYDKVNRVTHHALSWLVLGLIVAYFVFCAAFLSLRYIVLPNIDGYKSQVEQLASHFVNRNVLIAGIEASWHGLNPRLKLENVVIQNDQGESALVLPEVNATISWWSVMGELRLQALELSRPNLEIERDTEGRVLSVVYGLIPPSLMMVLDLTGCWHSMKLSSGRVSSAGAIQMRSAPELTLSNISFVLQNRWRTHRAALKATPPESMAAPIDLRVEFTHLPFSKTRADYAEWMGEFYIDWQKTHLEAWKPYIDMPYQLTGGRLAASLGQFRSWHCGQCDCGSVFVKSVGKPGSIA